MAFKVQLIRPVPVPFEQISGINSSNVYTADLNGVITVTNPGDVNPLINSAGFIYFGSGASLRNNFRNLIDGGDMTTNPFQRNIPGLASGGVISSAISNTVTYFADRFFGVGGASSAIQFSVVANTSVPGFSQVLKFQRQSGNSNTAVINMGEVIETLDSIHLQGQTVTFSVWLAAGANFSAANNLVSVQFFSGTGTNQSAANMVAGSWTGQTTFINATQVLTTNLVRYQFTGVVPVGCTQIGFLLSYTPVGTAGSDDSISTNGFQLEQGSNATDFERRDAQVELEICQRYCWVIAEPASAVVVGSGTTLGANAQTFYMATPVQLLKAPTVTVVTGGFKIAAGAAFATATITAGTTHTPNAISVNGTVTAAAGVGALLAGGGGTGNIIASADF